jgi:23S rRNA (uracil1939-C5)-methyltransferase
MMALPATRQLKRDLVVAALAREGLHPEVAETVGVGAASRRRAVLTATRSGGGIVLGYNERRSNRIVDIEECPILAPALADRLAGLRGLIGALVPGRKTRARNGAANARRA